MTETQVPLVYTYSTIEVANIHRPSDLLYLGGVYIPGEGRGRGNHCTHHRDERLGWESGRSQVHLGRE